MFHVALQILRTVMASGRRGLLETLVEFPAREFTISELARVSKVPFANAWRAVREWEQSGLVESRLVGRARVVKLANKNYAAKLLGAASVPSMQKDSVSTLRELLKKLPQVKKAFLFGSVAEGRESMQSDVDAALLVSKEFDAALLMQKFLMDTSCKLMPLQFTSARELEAFLKGKKTVQLK